MSSTRSQANDFLMRNTSEWQESVIGWWPLVFRRLFERFKEVVWSNGSRNPSDDAFSVLCAWNDLIGRVPFKGAPSCITTGRVLLQFGFAIGTHAKFNWALVTFRPSFIEMGLLLLELSSSSNTNPPFPFLFVESTVYQLRRGPLTVKGFHCFREMYSERRGGWRNWVLKKQNT